MDPEINEDPPGDQPEEQSSLEDQLAAALAPVDDAPAEKPADPGANEPLAGQVEPQPVEAAKPVDPKAAAEAEMYAPLPEHNPRRTHERFAKLVEGHKQVSQERDTRAQECEQLQGRIQEYEQGLQPLREMGFNTPEAVADLQQFSQYRRALASGNVEAAVNLLQEQARQLSLATGRRIEFNPLDRFQDLNQRHAAGELDEATAMELARARQVQQAQQQNLQRSQQEERQHAETLQMHHAAARHVDQVVVGLQRDPDYQRVEPELMKHLEFIKNNYPPQLWAQEVQRTYQNEARVLRLQAQQTQPRTPQPLRGNGHTGGQPAPTSMADAVLQSLGMQ